MASLNLDPKILKNNLNNITIYGDTPGDDFVESIKAHGVLEPLTVERDSKVIISGHRRRQAAIKAGLKKVPVNLVNLPDPDEQLQRLIESNRQREKTKEQRAREYQALLEVSEKLAKKRQAEAGGGKKPRKTAKPKKDANPAEKALSGNSPKRSGKAKDEAAAQVGMSAKTADQAAEVVGEIDAAEAAGDQAKADEIRQELETGSVASASRKAKTWPSGKEMTEFEVKTDTQGIATYLIREIGKVEKEFKRLVIEKDGNENNQHKTAHLQQNAQEFLTKLRNAKAVLQANKPHSECTFCDGDGRDCEKCLESGWLPKRQADIHGKDGG